MPEPKSPHVNSALEPDLVGRQLGDYLLLRRLGRGGMADVYLAEQKSLRRHVAFKVLHSQLAKDESYVRRFHNEAQAAASLVHAGIVQIHDVDCFEGIHYIAQEYVPGSNLQEVIANGGPLEVAAAVNIMRQVAAALHKAGEQGIIHRDIKPENILLTAKGELKVADFGLARIINEDSSTQSTVGLTQVGVTLGTPLYMSPEQVEGRELDHRSDLYSFGVTCYQLLAGHPPFQGDTALSVAVQHMNKAPERLESLRSELPTGLCEIIHKMLAKSPAQRHQSASELLRDLRSLHMDGLDEAWPSGIDEWSTQEMLSIASARTAATQQLQTVMLTETRLRRQTPAIWIALAVTAALLLGCCVAWFTRSDSLLADAETLQLERLETAEAQFGYAMRVGNEAAFQSVIDQFGADASPLSESYVNKARLQLAYIYYDANRHDAAMELLVELADQQTDLQLRAMGLIWQANIDAQRKNLSSASRKTFELAELIKLTEQLTPRQRQALREEAFQTLDARIKPGFRRQLLDLH